MQGLKEGQLPAPVKDWEVIEATAEEAHSLGCNTICLEPGVVIIGAEHKRLIREIEKRGVLVVAIPFDKPSELGGGIRCSTHPLLRGLRATLSVKVQICNHFKARRTLTRRMV
jgi:N-dimethylarginine dimethylaminohydrolase